jgi:hypothetical protein
VNDIKKHLIPAIVGAGLGILTTYALVWRDTAVIKAELIHIREDISLIQQFVSDDDPRSFMAAKNKIRKEREADRVKE